MKEKAKNIFLIFLAVLCVGYLLVTAILDLTNKADLHTIRVDAAFEIMEVEHSINGLIPIGKDHYYIGVTEETGQAYLIHASKSWFGKHFDDDYLAKDAGGVTLTALAKKVSDYSVSRELASRAEQIDGVTYPLGTDYCMERSYKSEAILKLVDLVLIAGLAWFGLRFLKNPEAVTAAVRKIYLVAVLGTIILLLAVLI